MPFVSVLHPELPSHTEDLEASEVITECKKTNWSDYYNRTEEDIAKIKEVIGAAIDDIEKRIK